MDKTIGARTVAVTADRPPEPPPPEPPPPEPPPLQPPPLQPPPLFALGLVSSRDLVSIGHALFANAHVLFANIHVLFATILESEKRTLSVLH